VDISKGGIVKKIIYSFILSLAIILPMNVKAAITEKLSCKYLTNDVEAYFRVYEDDKNRVTTGVTINKFGDNTWDGKETTGFGQMINVENYFDDVEENSISLKRYQDSKSGPYNCPKYILISDGGALGIFKAWASDDLLKISAFHDGFNNKNVEKHIAWLYNPSENKYPDRKCIYDNQASESKIDGMTGYKSFILDIENDKLILGKIRETGQLASVNQEHHIKIEDFKNGCAAKIWYKSETDYNAITPDLTNTVYTFYSSPDDVSAMNGYLSIKESRDPITGEEIENGGTYDPEYDGDSEDYIEPGAGIDIKEGCDIFSSDLKSWLIQLLDLIKVGGLVLTLVLGMLDFLKGVSSGEADAMKKVWKSFSRRLIAVIILFLLPLLIEFIFGLINISGINSSNPLCGIK